MPPRRSATSAPTSRTRQRADHQHQAGRIVLYNVPGRTVADMAHQNVVSSGIGLNDSLGRVKLA